MFSSIKKKSLKLLIVYLTSLFLATAIFISLFWIDLGKDIDFLFFKSLILLLVVSLILFLTLIFLKLRFSLFNFLTYRDVFLITLIFSSVNHAFFGLIPFNTSRSVSVMIVGYLYQNQKNNISEKDISRHIYKLYFDNEGAVVRRLHEQVLLGNVKKIEGGYILTERGIKTVEMMGEITAIYNMNKNYAFEKIIFPSGTSPELQGSQ